MGTEIHPTAIVDPAAEVGDGARIGPYCIVEAGAVLGPECLLQHHVTICGGSKIGPRNQFFAYASIGQRTQDLKYAGEPTHLEVGEGNTFREFTTANRGTLPGGITRIGNHGNFLAYSHIAHDCIVGDHVVFSNNGTLAGHVIVEDYAIIGGLTAIHQYCRIGRHTLTGGCSKIVQDVLPYMIADGNPAAIRGINFIGLERNGFSDECIRQIKEAFRLIYRSKLNLTQATDAIRSTIQQSREIDYLLDFLGKSERGIIR